MDISEIRCHNTRLLVDSYGTMARFADVMGRAHAQVGHWVGKNPTSENPHRQNRMKHHHAVLKTSSLSSVSTTSMSSFLPFLRSRGQMKTLSARV